VTSPAPGLPKGVENGTEVQPVGHPVAQAAAQLAVPPASGILMGKLKQTKTKTRTQFQRNFEPFSPLLVQRTSKFLEAPAKCDRFQQLSEICCDSGKIL